jgi:bifunctional DNA-binding transcriptional regulator/antitoxin component of YhaV-PrlF toxin-antitoxin module
MMQSWTVVVTETDETGQFILPLPEELTRLLNWQVGDTVEWKELPNGAWSIRRLENERSSIHK